MKNHEIKKDVILEKKGNVGIITLDRPDRLNALNNGVITQIMDNLNNLKNDDEAKVIVITGNGDKAFCSGADLKDPEIGNTDKYSEYLETYYQGLVKAIKELKIPVIAAVNGAVVGAGIGLVLSCDYIIMSENAYLYPAFVRIGLVPDSGVMSFLVRRLGKYKAFEVTALAKSISAKEALKWGLANKLVSQNDLMKEAMKIAKDLARMPVTVVGLIKLMAGRAEELTLSEFFKMESDFQKIAADTKDHLEGVKAFLEKREPHFTGE